MRIPKYYLLLIALGLLAYAMGCKNESAFNSAEDMVALVKARTNIISVDNFRSIMGRGENFKLIDCRVADELTTGYMPGAIHISRGMLEFQITEKIPLRNARIFIYCNTGDRSTLAAATLREMKYSDVTSIAGGFDAWALKYPDKIITKPIEKEIAPKSKEQPIPDGGSCGG